MNTVLCTEHIYLCRFQHFPFENVNNNNIYRILQICTEQGTCLLESYEKGILALNSHGSCVINSIMNLLNVLSRQERNKQVILYAYMYLKKCWLHDQMHPLTTEQTYSPDHGQIAKNLEICVRGLDGRGHFWNVLISL